jgi:hypothetical protein|tara:strand:- start:34 stop:153 length:120 start_codon:yes stop_codon:yes gene_type:complete
MCKVENNEDGMYCVPRNVNRNDYSDTFNTGDYSIRRGEY